MTKQILMSLSSVVVVTVAIVVYNVHYIISFMAASLPAKIATPAVVNKNTLCGMLLSLPPLLSLVLPLAPVFHHQLRHLRHRLHGQHRAP
jgi:hypothetical protein